MRFTDHSPTNPINVMASLDSGNNFSPPSPSVTTTIDNALILSLGAFDDDDITVDAPGLSGHTVITMDESGSGSGMVSGGAGYVEQSASGASGTSAFTLTAEQQSRTLTIAIAPVIEGGESQIRP